MAALMAGVPSRDTVCELGGRLMVVDGPLPQHKHVSCLDLSPAACLTEAASSLQLHRLPLSG